MFTTLDTTIGTSSVEVETRDVSFEGLEITVGISNDGAFDADGHWHYRPSDRVTLVLRAADALRLARRILEQAHATDEVAATLTAAP